MFAPAPPVNQVWPVSFSMPLTPRSIIVETPVWLLFRHRWGLKRAGPLVRRPWTLVASVRCRLELMPTPYMVTEVVRCSTLLGTLTVLVTRLLNRPMAVIHLGTMEEVLRSMTGKLGRWLTILRRTLKCSRGPRLGPNPKVLRSALTVTVRELMLAWAMKLRIRLGLAQPVPLVLMSILLLMLVSRFSLFLMAMLRVRVHLIIPPARVIPLLQLRRELLTTMEAKLLLT